MPHKIEWVEPDLFLEHKGVKIFHAYKDGAYDQPLTMWYAVEDEYDSDGIEFDVRDLPTAKGKGLNNGNRKKIASAIRAAIDAGMLGKGFVNLEKPARKPVSKAQAYPFSHSRTHFEGGAE